MKHLLLLFGIVAGTGAVRPAIAQSCAQCPPIAFEDTAVRVTVGSTAASALTPASTGAGQYRATVAASGTTPLPAALPAGRYAAWCGMHPQDAVGTGTFTATTAPPIAPAVWNRINYILNHKIGTILDVQEALWTLLGTMTVAELNATAHLNAIAMYQDATVLGDAFTPAAGQRIGVLLRASAAGYQHLILELVNCGTIGDRVWRDTNGNGAADLTEAGLNGVTVQLLDAAGAVLATAVTAPSPVDYPFLTVATDGWYRFAGYCPGAYHVKVDPAQPALGGAQPTTPASPAANLGSAPVQNADFGFNAGAPPLQVSCPQDWAQGGASYASKVRVTGGAAPYAIAYTGSLPNGLSMDGAGNILGTPPYPAQAGTYSFNALVSASGATPASAVCAIAIAPQLSLECPAPAAQAGRPYSASLTPSGGSGAYTAGTTTPDSFPPGLSVERRTGRVTGTPAAAGSFAFTAAVDDRGGLADAPRSRPCSLTVAAAPTPLTVQCASPSAIKGVGYNSAFVAAGGAGPYRYSVGGALPPGLMLDTATGRISGSPSQAGSFSFTIQAQDSAGATASLNCGILVERAFTLVCPNAAGYAGLAYASGARVSGGTGPFSFTGASLPAGVALDTVTGAIAGIPASAASYSMVIGATDGATGASESAACRLQIYTPPVLTCPSATALPGVPYFSALTAAGGAGRHTFALASGALPTGWSLDPQTGVLAAAAPLAAVVSFTARLTDDAGTATATAQAACSIRVTAPLSLTCATQSAEAGSAYSSALAAAGGVGPSTFSISAGALPPGLSLNASTGAITERPRPPGPTASPHRSPTPRARPRPAPAA